MNTKFRVWNGKKFVYMDVNDLIIHIQNNTYKDYGDISIENVKQQCTGVVDKNDKEIYDGDIVRYSSSRENLEYIGMVEWSDDAKFTLHSKRRGWADLTGGYYGQLEVIGNIFETPGLLT